MTNKFEKLIWIPGEGPTNAQLMLVGEAGGKYEEEQKRPFVGPSGNLVNSILQETGIPRTECYITNVCKTRPPDNKLERLSELGVTIADFEPLLWDEVNLVKPNCILALGGTALKTLTGKDGITKYRGSILQSNQGYPKVVGTLHPANFLEKSDTGESGLYKWNQLAYVKFDFRRAYEQSQFKEFRLPNRNLWVCRDSLSFMQFINRNRHQKAVAIDIETFKTIPICVALSFDPQEAVSIPICDLRSNENPRGIGLDELKHIWKLLSEVLYDENIEKVGQNFKFDERCLKEIGFIIKGFGFDTMLGFHSIYPEFPKRLEFISSILTDEPYYKSEGREYNPKKDDVSRLLLYNAKDAGVTQEVRNALLPELREYGVTDFFQNFVMKLHDLYMYIEDQGIKCDEKQRQAVIAKYEEKGKEVDKRIEELIGYELNVESNPQVCNLIYNDLRCPQRTRRRKGGYSSLTADEKAITSLLANVIKDEKRRSILQYILDRRGITKALGTYLGVPKPTKKSKLKRYFADSDGRVRTNYLITGTESGRTSTNLLEPPVRADIYGLSYQTIPKHGELSNDIRSIFIPEEGYCFIEADQSQAESRIALLFAEDYETLKWMDIPGNDLHLLRASWACGTTYDEQVRIYKSGDSTYRQIGKHTGHANDNGVGKKRAAEMVFEYSSGEIQISEWRAQKYLDNINRMCPGIHSIFHQGVQNCLEKDRVLIDSFGAKRTFFNKWGDDLFKEAYAHIKQTHVTHQTQKSALQIHEQANWIKILLEWHDSLLFEVPIWRVDSAIPIIKESFEQPIDFSKCSLPRGELIIPCEMKISYTRWSEMVKI